MKRVILVLEYDMGCFDDDDERMQCEEPQEWGETFYQRDVIPNEMEIVGWRDEEIKKKGRKNAKPC